MRGGHKVEEEKENIIIQGINLIDQLSNQDIIKLINEADISTKETYTALGRKLFKQANHLTSASFNQIRPLIKAIAVLIYIKFISSDYTERCKYIISLHQSCTELKPHSRYITIILHCYKEAIQIWSQLNKQSLNEILPELDCENVKSSIFHSYCYIASTTTTPTTTSGASTTTGTVPESDVSDEQTINRLQALGQAMELALVLPDNIQIVYINTSIQIGREMYNSKQTQYSIQVFQNALYLIETINTKQTRVHTQRGHNSDHTEMMEVIEYKKVVVLMCLSKLYTDAG